jgi:hypothetical protein
MSRAPLLAVFGVLALAAVVVLACSSPPRARADSRSGNASAVEPYLDPQLRSLLTQTTCGERYDDSLFFRTLSAIAGKHGWRPPDRRTEEGRAVSVREGNNRYAVVVLTWDSRINRGENRQELLLLGPDGRLLDQLLCSICNVLLAEGVFRTDTPQAPAGDGAQFIIRFVPNKGRTISDRWAHSIEHGTKNVWVGRDEDRPGPFRQDEWVRQGLCRVAVRHGKFEILFPPLEK